MELRQLALLMSKSLLNTIILRPSQSEAMLDELTWSMRKSGVTIKALKVRLPTLRMCFHNVFRKFSLHRDCLEDTRSSVDYAARKLTITADSSSFPDLNESGLILEDYLCIR